jgi:hypothetical protein
MPFGNGTGPGGKGGRGMGAGRGSGQGKGRWRIGGKELGTGGNCVCPACGEVVSHQQGVPCYQFNCPKCRTKMIRQ